ncbi:hypothetical protein D3C71_250180 [compost metagenome]
MAKLNFGDLRREAAIADAARQSAAANREHLIDNVYAYAYETSREGILTLLRLAHLSMVSEGFPTEVPTLNEFQSTGREPVLRMDSSGHWSASLSKVYDGPEQRPTGRYLHHGRSNRVRLAEAVAAAAGIPSAGGTAKSIHSALNPIEERDFDHFGAILDRIPLRTLSAMLGSGPQLVFDLGIGVKDNGTSHVVDGEWYPDVEYTDDVAKLALCIGEAMFRRMGPVSDHGTNLTHMIAEVEGMTKDQQVRRGMEIPKPTFMTILAPHTPAETIRDFLNQAVRVGFDINAVDGRAGYGGLPTAAHKAVTLLTVRDLDAAVSLGLDLEFADSLRSLTEVVVDKFCRRMTRHELPMLKHLVIKYGLAVSQDSYQQVAKALGEAYQRDPDPWPVNKEDERLWEKRTGFLKEAILFLDEKFPDLHSKKKRKAA